MEPIRNRVATWQIRRGKFDCADDRDFDEVQKDLRQLAEEFGYVWAQIGEKATWDALLHNKDDKTGKKIGVRALREDIDKQDQALAAIRQEIGQKLDSLAATLEEGIHEPLRQLCETQLAAIEEKLKELAKLDEHARTAAQAELVQLRSETAALKADIKESRVMLDAMQIAAAQAKASQAVAETSARQATETMTACATFWGRLRWLFVGPAR